MNSARRKLIDAAEVPTSGDWVGGDTGSGDYTTVAFEEGVGKGATFTPAKGDTGKTLFVPNAGNRMPAGSRNAYGTIGDFWSATNYDTSTAWSLWFYNPNPSGAVGSDGKLWAFSLRCVRS